MARDGFVILEGSAPQLHELVESPEWMADRLNAEATYFNCTVGWLNPAPAP